MIKRVLQAKPGLSWSATVELGRSVSLVATIILVARFLGPTGLGAYAGVMAGVGFLTPFASAGMGHVLVSRVSVDQEQLEEAWGHAIRATLVAGLVLTASCAGLAVLITGATLAAVLALAAAELVLGSLTVLASQVQLGLGRFRTYAMIQLTGPLLRLVAAVVATLASVSSLTSWAMLYMIAAAGACLVSRRLAGLRMLPRVSGVGPRGNWRLGLQFSVTQLAHGVVNDLDKVFLAAAGDLNVAGEYSAAYRILNLVYMPARAVQTWCYPKFFQHGALGVHTIRRFGLRVTAAASLYGLFAGVSLFLGAPLLPVILGSDYAGSVGYLRLLSVMPLLKCAQWFLGDTLSGFLAQRTRASIQLASALLTAGALVYAVPRYAAWGAAWTTLVVETGTLIALGVAVGRLRDRPTLNVPAAAAGRVRESK